MGLEKKKGNRKSNTKDHQILRFADSRSLFANLELQRDAPLLQALELLEHLRHRPSALLVRDAGGGDEFLVAHLAEPQVLSGDALEKRRFRENRADRWMDG